ncbi:MAG: DUF429 domain-containing protein [Methanobacterium sp.]|nr:DUF429 domain-containing protein [Methanobacterium sp.]
MKFIGIDLAGKEENPTGICILNEETLRFETLFYDEEIVDLIKKYQPDLTAIDAPLSLPLGRCCLEKDCECAEYGHFRQAEREIRLYGRVLPLTFRGMKMLTFRGIKLRDRLKRDFKIIETHPRTSQKMLGLDLIEDLEKILTIPGNPSEHELDALLAAITGYLYCKGCYIELGAPDEGIIIIPRDEDCLQSCFKSF